MTGRLLQTVLRQAEALAADAGPDAIPDAELLARFAELRDESAFAALVRRHGPMVWAVCRHLLPNPADAEDAFQATFLALVRSAGKVRAGAAVGAWLHGVAVRAAAKLKRSAVRRKQREERAAGPEADRSVPEGAWDELLAAVHEEVGRLPEALRTAFVLCDLEGVRQPDAAARLGWKLGTLSGRLTKARQRLLARLADRGIAAGAVAIGTAAAGAAVPSALTGKVLGLATAATDAVPPAIWQLALEVTPMTVNRTKLIAACVLVAGGLGIGFGTALVPDADAQGPPTADARAATTVRPSPTRLLPAPGEGGCRAARCPSPGGGNSGCPGRVSGRAWGGRLAGSACPATPRPVRGRTGCSAGAARHGDDGRRCALVAAVGVPVRRAAGVGRCVPQAGGEARPGRLGVRRRGRGERHPGARSREARCRGRWHAGDARWQPGAASTSRLVTQLVFKRPVRSGSARSGGGMMGAEGGFNPMSGGPMTPGGPSRPGRGGPGSRGGSPDAGGPGARDVGNAGRHDAGGRDAEACRGWRAAWPLSRPAGSRSSP